MTIDMDISDPARAYFIAEIGFNHEGSLDRAKSLIRLAAESGANAAKFQHIMAEELGSREGFDRLYRVLRSKAQHNVHAMDAYKKAEIPLDWTKILREECHNFGLDFITAPYYVSDVELLAEDVDAFKVGSGDFAWIEKNSRLVSTGKPVFLACGASDMETVEKVVGALQAFPSQICLMQCNSNYTGESGNHSYLNLNVLRTFQSIWPEVRIGLSDHTKDLSVIVAARALGATVFERHFTDDSAREGADHLVALNPNEFSEMVGTVRIVEETLGDGVKRIEENEVVGAMTQRRALRFARDFERGQTIAREDITVLRPWMEGSLLPSDLDKVIGQKVAGDFSRGQEIQFNMLVSDERTLNIE